MSILIKGMEMPTNCADCKLRMAVRCCGNLPHNTRMPNCPVGPVPPHGRLVDADALVADTSFFDGGDWHYGYSSKQITNAPTIIPASEEENK